MLRVWIWNFPDKGWHAIGLVSVTVVLGGDVWGVVGSWGLWSGPMYNLMGYWKEGMGPRWRKWMLGDYILSLFLIPASLLPCPLYEANCFTLTPWFATPQPRNKTASGILWNLFLSNVSYSYGKLTQRVSSDPCQNECQPGEIYKAIGSLVACCPSPQPPVSLTKL